MNRNIESYVKVYSNWFSPEVCEETIHELQTEHWQQHVFYNTATKSSAPVSGSKELDVCFGPISTTPYFNNRMWEGYKEYVLGFNFPWFCGWQSFSEPRFNRYRETRLMASHCDHIHSMFDGERKGIPILSGLGVLNDDYEGGEFVMWEDTVIPLKGGDLIVFPSNFLYPHRVDPVTKGERYSVVTWCY